MVSSDHLDVASDSGGVRKTGVSGEQRARADLGERHEGSVGDGEVVAQFPAAMDQRPVRSALEPQGLKVFERKCRPAIVEESR